MPALQELRTIVVPAVLTLLPPIIEQILFRDYKGGHSETRAEVP